jgi:hypothetical protein
MTSLFVSHGSKDNEVTRQLKDRLIEKGYRSVFLDYDPELGIPAGQNWEEELYRNLKICQALIAICSQNFSCWCFAEIAVARALGKRIFAVKVDASDVDKMLHNGQIIDLSKEGEVAYARLWDGLHRAGLDPNDSFGWDPVRPPYPGLNAFEEPDAAVYFGREAEIEAVLEALNRMRRRRDSRLALVVGASGCGKSSLVRAGVLPRLKKDRQQWLTLPPFRPGAVPLSRLARVLANAAENLPATHAAGAGVSLAEAPTTAASSSASVVSLAREIAHWAESREATAVVVIDQMEELLNFGGQQTAEFLKTLRQILDAHHGALLVLATVRSDFLGAVQNHPELTGLPFETIPLGPMPPTHFSQVIEKPGARVALSFEDGLIVRMVHETNSEHALPLLAFTLRALYDRCAASKRFLIKDYEAVGGIQGAVAEAANRLASQPRFAAVQRELRVAFLKMVQLNEKGQHVRRSTRWDDLPAAIHPIMEEFLNARLLTSHGQGAERMVEVAHESLFEVWPKLDGWLKANQTFLLWYRRFEQEVKAWETDGRRGKCLLQGGHLVDATKWLRTNADDLDDVEKRFIKLSQRRDRRLRLLLYATLAGIAALILLIFWDRRQREAEAALRIKAAAAKLAEAAKHRDELHARLDNPMRVHELLSDIDQWGRRLKESRVLWQRAQDLANEEPERISTNLNQQIRDLKRDLDADQDVLKLAEELGDLRLEASTELYDGKFDYRRAAETYPKVFDRLGLSVNPDLSAKIVGERIKQSPACFVLVPAIDHWAAVTVKPELRAKLLEVARTADPHGWRDRFRDPAVWKDLEKLQSLADEVQLSEHSPSIVVALAGRLRSNGGQAAAVKLLRSALRDHPRDF